MKRITLRTVSMFFFIGVAFWTLAASALPGTATPRVLMQFDEATLPKGSIEFQRGVFRIEEGGARLSKLCIQVNGIWKQVGDMKDCGNPPPSERRREIVPFASDVTILGIRNLGINKDEWKTVQSMFKSGKPGNAYFNVGEAFSFNVGTSAVGWHFDSQKLPAELKTPVPGSGIHMHFGGLFSKEHMLSLFDSDSGAFEVELGLAVPKFVHSNKAHSGLTVAIDLMVQTAAGTAVAMPVIVNLFSPNPINSEVMTSDGRTNFASSYLGSGTKYVQQVENQQQTAPWTALNRFAFKITRENAKKILADANARRRDSGAELLDESSLDKIMVAGVTLRNESRFLDEGNVEISVAVDYLRIVRLN